MDFPKLKMLVESGAEKAVKKLAVAGAKAGKPPLSKDAVEKSFGGPYYDVYIKAYNDTKQKQQDIDDHEAWREKRAAALQGRHYHE